MVCEVGCGVFRGVEMGLYLTTAKSRCNDRFRGKSGVYVTK